MGYFVNTTIGGCYPNETGAYINNPGYPGDPDPAAVVGTLTCGSDQIIVTQYRVMGSTGIYVKVGSASPEFHQMYNGFTKVGFYATQSGDTVKVYYVCTNSEENVNGQETLTQQSGSGALYGAYLLGTYSDSILDRDWDQTPGLDDGDPFGDQGGEDADRMPFGPYDQMPISELPNPDDIAYSSFCKTFILGSASIATLSSRLFHASTWTQLKQNFEGLGNPMDFIIKCHELPLNLTTDIYTEFDLGGVPVRDENGDPLYMPAAASRFYRIMCGSVTLKEVWGTSKDYSDISIHIFLPYVGMKELDPDIVVGSTLSLQCHVDIWTGDVLYLLHTDNNDISGKYYRQQCVPYRFTGNCASELPVGKVDNSNAIGGVGKAIAGGMAAFAIGGTLGMAAAMYASAGSVGSGDWKPTYQSSGAVGGSTGLMDYQKPYIVIKRAVPQYPEGWKHEIGAPNYQGFTISSLSGFTVFHDVHLINMPGASKEEIDQLTRELTTEGIIL